MIEIREATSLGLIEIVRGLLMEYGALPDVSIGQHELAGLPGEYAPPTGALLIAMEGPSGAGSVALRRLDAQTCEMKRLYVRPKHRGREVGKMLAHEMIARGRALGYSRMRLDTRPSMRTAIALYHALGFREIPPYLSNPVPGALFFELELKQRAIAGR